MNKFINNFTIVLVSYRSKHKIFKLVSKLSKNFKIIIVENSNDKSIEKKFTKFKNILFYYPDQNKGFGAGLNYGVKKAKSKFILYLDIDTKINNYQIEKLCNKIKKVKDFGVVTAKIKDQDYKDLILGLDKKTSMKYVKFNTGVVMVFKRRSFLKMGGFDENYFLYFEETDYYLRCIKKNKKIYLFENILVEHEGQGSIDGKLKIQYAILRNWHYCWSKFNYYNKHYSYLRAISKTFPNLVKSIKGIFHGIIKFNSGKINLHFAELGGLFSAYLRLNSFYRIN
tara:strand:- start:115 stop:963 length:849 start_codon:yes stop_codon:yes gene_type:complete